MPQAANHRPLSTKVWVRFQAILCGIYGGRIGTGTRFSPNTFIIMLCQYHTTHVPFLYLIYLPQTRGYAVAQLVKTLRYKPESRGFISRWSFRPHCCSGVDSASNRNEYQEYFLASKGGRCIGLTTLPPSCADCLEIWEPQPSGNLRACPGL